MVDELRTAKMKTMMKRRSRSVDAEADLADCIIQQSYCAFSYMTAPSVHSAQQRANSELPPVFIQLAILRATFTNTDYRILF